MGRISRLDNADFAKAVGEAYAKGLSRSEMSDLFGAHEDTITIWVRDPRVQAHAGRVALERVNRVTRKLDAEVERRLDDVEDEDKYPMEVLLKWRRELLDRPGIVSSSKDTDQPETINEVISALEENPEFAAELRDTLGGSKKRTKKF